MPISRRKLWWWYMGVSVLGYGILVWAVGWWVAAGVYAVQASIAAERELLRRKRSDG